jgi:SET domain-containing protein
MLLIPVKIDRSPIHGLGIFAVTPIAKGTRVWQFTPGFDLDIDPRKLEQHPKQFQEKMLHYGYIDPRLNRFILCCDDYRFVNHSANPTICIDTTANRYGVDFAARDIAFGEELTVDYEILEGSHP